jgi:tRNA dimethylallyltransferase
MRAPVVILGPTASGKSDVAMAAALATPGTEIVAVDAMQVYRGMDIGTAKPTPADRAAVPHHCLDLVEPIAEMSVTEFRDASDAAVAGIDARGGQPLLVAGTGLYLTAILDRLELPGTWPEVRAELESELDTAVLYGRLRELDLPASLKIAPSNRRRVVRALEVTLGSGRRFSSFGPGVGAFPPTDAVQIGIRWPRAALVDRIERRVHDMMDRGLLDEVIRLGATGLSITARQALGYKELLDHIEGDASLDDAVAAIIVRTRQFAVRQERWFRRDPRVRWVDIDPGSRDPLEPVRAALEAELQNQRRQQQRTR